MPPADYDSRGRPRQNKPLPDEWGPIKPTPSVAAALRMLVEHELHMKKRFVAMHSPIEARNARIIRERLIATLVEAHMEETLNTATGTAKEVVDGP